MELSSLPDIRFKLCTGTKHPFRIQACDETPSSPEQYLRAWKPPKKSKQTTRAVEEDEPIEIVCGIENPFAGIFEDAEVDGTAKLSDSNRVPSS
jgi:hypothetical protein